MEEFWIMMKRIYQFFGIMMDSIFYKGADFSSWEDLDKLGISMDNGYKYQPSINSIKRVFRKLNVSEKDSIIDIGCGKGKAMYLMSRCSFGKVEGFDLSEKMVDIANSNFRLLDARCRAFCADAALYEQYDEYNFFYAFNPVPLAVFDVLISKIQKNILLKPRKCIFVYLNPLYHDILIKYGFRIENKYGSIIPWNKIYVYSFDGKGR